MRKEEKKRKQEEKKRSREGEGEAKVLQSMVEGWERYKIKRKRIREMRGRMGEKRREEKGKRRRNTYCSEEGIGVGRGWLKFFQTDGAPI